MANAQIFRIEKTENFTVISNTILRDSTLSLSAKGLLIHMLSLPENWDYSLAGLAAIVKEGKCALRSILRELERHGYLKRQRIRSDDGTFAGIEYHIFESPRPCEKTGILQTAKNFVQPKQANPQHETPQFDIPHVGSQTQINTYSNQPLKEKSKKKIDKEVLAKYFKEFWDVFPKKRQKLLCSAWWNKQIESEEMAKTILQAVKDQKKSKEWKETEFMFLPKPLTWLEDGRWEEKLTKMESSYDIDEMEERFFRNPVNLLL